jgi:hypothetical protein
VCDAINDKHRAGSRIGGEYSGTCPFEDRGGGIFADDTHAQPAGEVELRTNFVRARRAEDVLDARHGPGAFQVYNIAQ